MAKFLVGKKSKVTNFPKLYITSTTPGIKMESLLIIQVIGKAE